MNTNSLINDNNNYGVAQFVILDVGLPNLAHISVAVLNSVRNILCLSQANHIPAVGLALINASYQPVFRLSSTQTPLKLQKILQVIDTVKTTGKSRSRITVEEFQDYIHLGVKTIIEDFKTLPDHLTEEEVCPGKLQITIFSMKNLSETLNHLQTGLPFSKQQNLFKVLVVELVEEIFNPACYRKEQCFHTMFEYLQVRGTDKKLNELLKQWLSHEDEQHLQLVVQHLTVWCDARDCIVGPSSPCDAPQGQGSDEEAADDVEVLEVIRRVPTEGICETHTFGAPVLLLACQSQNHFKPEERQELSLNSQYFLDICKKLGMSDEYFIAKYENTNKPVRFMLLMPGAGFLLAKELVSAEMALSVPDVSTHLSTHITAEVDSSVTAALVSLPAVSPYDPSDFSSGLYKHLLRKIQRSAMEPKQAPSHRDPYLETIVVGVEVKKKTKLRRKSSDRKRPRKYVSDLPQLTERDQQTLAQCISKNQGKIKPSNTVF